MTNEIHWCERCGACVVGVKLVAGLCLACEEELEEEEECECCKDWGWS